MRNWRNAEPRTTGLFQTALRQLRIRLKAVLEQPSSRRMAEQALGRRNIALAETAS
jgi:hypothetical protein